MLATDHTLFACFVSQSLVPKLCPHCSIPAAEALANGHHEHTKKHVERILTSCRPDDTPRFIGYMRHAVSRYSELAPLGRLLDEVEKPSPG